MLRFKTKAKSYPLTCDSSVMCDKGHGSTKQPVQQNLRWGCDRDMADRLCCFNRSKCERPGYWQQTTFRTFIASPSVAKESKPKRSFFLFLRRDEPVSSFDLISIIPDYHTNLYPALVC